MCLSKFSISLHQLLSKPNYRGIPYLVFFAGGGLVLFLDEAQFCRGLLTGWDTGEGLVMWAASKELYLPPVRVSWSLHKTDPSAQQALGGFLHTMHGAWGERYQGDYDWVPCPQGARSSVETDVWTNKIHLKDAEKMNTTSGLCPTTFLSRISRRTRSRSHSCWPHFKDNARFVARRPEFQSWPHS